jgi:hypothetical protein
MRSAQRSVTPSTSWWGSKGKSFTVAALAAAGVKRISLATSLYRAAMTGLLRDAGSRGVHRHAAGSFYAINGLTAEGGSAARSLNSNSPIDLAQREDGLYQFAFSVLRGA